MKRLLVLVIVACLLLCGCSQTVPTPTEPSQRATTPTSTEPASEKVTDPTQTQSEKVTVYLLEKSVLYDSGATVYHYDEDYNLDSYIVYTIENDIMYTAHFEEKDANGMACRYWAEWPGYDGADAQTLTYSDDGKIQEIRYAGDTFCGTRYVYDLDGNLIEKQDFYEDSLQAAVYYEYDGDVLTLVYGEDMASGTQFECILEDGRIVEKICRDSDSSYSYFYEYDEHGNLIQESFVLDGEVIPSEQYSYQPVEVDADRAPYLLEQQKYLLAIA
ncbi:MAG: hypothetical protein IJX69_01045 [Oscillospiraceae bacterium]|nr:hypothetical protein [Oscillospiraceae bacterium]